MKAINNVREALNTNISINIKVTQGYNKKVRIDSRSRFPKADIDNFFSKWVSYDYANRIYKDLTGKNLSEAHFFNY